MDRFTDAHMRFLAVQALQSIAETPRQLVKASRPGIVAFASTGAGFDLGFRRVGDRVRMELWPNRGCTGIQYYDLPPHLEKLASQMLDGL